MTQTACHLAYTCAPNRLSTLVLPRVAFPPRTFGYRLHLSSHIFHIGHFYPYCNIVRAGLSYCSMKGARRSSRPTTSVLRRGSSSFYSRLPQVMEEFQVLWDLGGKLEWWSGELLQNPTQSPSNNNIYVATLRYKPRGRYQAVDYEVAFYPVKSKDCVKRLQHTSPLSLELTPWKFPDEVVDKTQFARTDKLSLASRTQSTNAAVVTSSESILHSGDRSTA